MNLSNKLNSKQIDFIEKITNKEIKDKEYTEEEVNIMKRKIVEYGMGESSKNGGMDRAMKEVNTILNIL